VERGIQGVKSSAAAADDEDERRRQILSGLEAKREAVYHIAIRLPARGCSSSARA